MLKKISLVFLLIFLCSIQNLAYANHPIYVLLTHPRATATAFEKIVRTHGGLTVIHQPFLDAYLLKVLPSDHPYRESLNKEETYDSVRDRLFELAEESPLFFKEQSYIVIDFLKANPDFFRAPQVQCAILVREPAKTILSLYRKSPEFTNNSEIGHEQLWDLFNRIRNETGKTPLVIDADELLKDPMLNLNALGAIWNIEFKESDLYWEKGYEEEWLHIDKKWYDEVAHSTQLDSYKNTIVRLDDGTPEFAEIENLEDRKRLQDYFHYQNVYYQKLLDYAVKPR